MSILKYLGTLLISMIPVIELRGAIPIAVFSFHLSYVEAFLISFIGNIIPVYFILKYIRPIFELLKRVKILKKIIDWITEKATKKIAENKRLEAATLLGIYLFVAIPLPGTGAWTGSLIANFLELPPKKVILPIYAGVFTAGVIILAITAIAHGGINYLFTHI